MTFSDFLQLMYLYIGCDVTKQDYVLYNRSFQGV